MIILANINAASSCFEQPIKDFKEEQLARKVEKFLLENNVVASVEVRED